MNQSKQTYPIKGMHCASCVKVTERALSQVPGVESAIVNLATEQATITYDSNVATPSQFAQAIAKTGYTLELNRESPDTIRTQKTQELTNLRTQVIISLSLGFLILWGSFPGLISTAPSFLTNFYLQWLLATPIQFWAGLKFYQAALPALKNRNANMDTLVVIGTTVAYFYSVFVVLFPQVLTNLDMEVMPYFDVSSLVIGLILLGRYFESQAKAGTSDAIKKLIGLQAKTARVIRGDQEIDIPIDQVQVGDTIRIRPGDKIPVDGQIIQGESSIDESMISGESIPVDKTTNDLVIGSTINKLGTFTYRATKVGSDTMLAQIIKLVQDAQGSKAPIQRLADTVSSYFVPIVIMLAFLTFGIWYVFGPIPTFLHAMLNTVAVLIIACPCAMGLATPTAIMVGTGLGAQKGILIKDAQSLETANQVQTIIFDKTGTLTKGKPQVTDIIPTAKYDANQILQLAASLEYGSEHSLAQAIISHATNQNLTLSPVTKFSAIAGHGIQGQINNHKLYLGNSKLMEIQKIVYVSHINQIAQLQSEGKTLMLLAQDQKLIGLIAVADTIKDSAKQAIQELKNLNLDVVMITGDNQRTAQAIANQLDINHFFAEVLPDQKESYVKKFQSQGKKIAMVGDGINDAPALARADVGIAIGTGTDIAIETANITLINPNLNSVAKSIRLSHKTMRTIKLNLFWAFGYNIILIPIAMGILYPFFGITLNPILASMAMALSSISVVSNSLLLKKATI